MANYCHGMPRSGVSKKTRGKKPTEVFHPMQCFDHSLPEAHNGMDSEVHGILHSHYRLKTPLVFSKDEVDTEGLSKIRLQPWTDDMKDATTTTTETHLLSVEKLEETNFWYHWAGCRLLTLKCKLNTENEGDGVPECDWLRQIAVSQHTFEILGVKCSTGSISKSTSRRSPNLTLTYVATSGPGFTPIDLEREVSRLAHFASLKPHNAAARFELLTTPTARYVLQDVSNLQVVPQETGHEYFGCGFIPPSLLAHAQGEPGVTAIQVRVVAPRLGIFKGMLCAKPGITKIQLPTSMQKVGPVEEEQGDDWAVIVIVSGTGVHPNKANRKVDEFLKAGRGELLSQEFAELSLPQQVSRSGMREIPPPIARLLKGLGVPHEVFAGYVDRGPLQWKHASVVGVADPTGTIPRGHVFVTGLLGGIEMDDATVFVTRHPPVELKDGARMPMVSERPLDMSVSDWEFLSGIGFGMIFFSTQQEELIAEGDLDGDEYFVCWEPSILSSLPPPKMPMKEVALEPGQEEPQAQKQAPSVANGQGNEGAHGWLQHTQHHMLNVELTDKINHLVSTLCTEAMKIAVNDGENLSHPDVVALSKAYKMALNIGKHGGKVRLAPHLHSRIPVRLHEFLT